MKNFLIFILMSTLLFSFDFPSFEKFESFPNFNGKVKELRLYESSLENKTIEEALKTVSIKKVIYFNENRTKKRVDTYSDDKISYNNLYDNNGNEVFEGDNTYDEKGRILQSIVKPKDPFKSMIKFFYSDDGKVEEIAYFYLFDGYYELDVSTEITKNEKGLIVQEFNKYGGANHMISNKIEYLYDDSSRLIKSRFQFVEVPLTYTISNISYNSNNQIESIVQNTFNMGGKLLDTVKMFYKYSIINKNAVYVVEYVNDEPSMLYKQEIIF